MILIVSACGGVASEDQIVVSAASSLTDAFAELEAAFEEANPGVDVLVNLGGSALLREQIMGGAPIDVFASANTSIMDQLVGAGEIEGEPRIFVLNQLQIAVPFGNPGGVAGLADLANESLFIGLCSQSVPCGSAARSALASAGVDPAVDTNEPNARSLLTKIVEGELDAGIVYVTDVIASKGQVTGIEIPARYNQTVEYPIAVTANSPNPKGAADFVGFVLSEEGQAILSQHGFTTP